MSVNEDSYAAGSDSFWEVGKYKRTVDRHENGGKLCDELVKLIRDRATIEKEYAHKLKNFAKSWNERIDKGMMTKILHNHLDWPEYGTTASAWKGILTEADQMAEIHLRIREKLIEEVETEITKWKKENFKKSALGPCKETKAIDDEFKKAQKPWEKRYAKVKKCKKEYHTSCKNEKSALHQESNARADSGLSPDQIKKAQDKVEKCQREVESTKDKYENALSDLNSYNAKYMEDMSEVFSKSQEAEKKRLMFFKEMLFGIHKCLDLSQSAEIPAIYNQYASTIKQADHDQDLKWWSVHHGAEMPMNWPQFEPYKEEFHDIRGGWAMPGRKDNNAEAVTLRRINLDKHNQEFPEYSPDLHTISRKEKKQGGVDSGVTMTSIKRNESVPGAGGGGGGGHQPATTTTSLGYGGRDNNVDNFNSLERNNMVNNTKTTTSNPVSEDKNPFGDDDNEWAGEYDNPLSDDGAAGVPVRALYDYEGAEDDELTFKVGEVFVKLADRDDQGWCKGRINGVVGLYPDNYVEVISG